MTAIPFFLPQKRPADSDLIMRLFDVPLGPTAEIVRWEAMCDAEVVERQRKAMNPQEFNHLTCDGKYPYAGAIGGGTTYVLSPTSNPAEYSIRVEHALSKHNLVLTSSRASMQVWATRQQQVHTGNSFLLELNKVDFEQWCASLGIPAGESPWPYIAIKFNPNGIGMSVALVHLPSGTEKDFTDYSLW